MIHNNQCEICREPTKRPVGFWDGYTKDGKRTGGYLYTCGNMECHIRQEEAKRELEEKQRTERALNENRRNNVDIHRMKRIRRLVGMTIADCAKAIGVSPSTFSNYENFREPMPPQEFNKIMAILKEG